VPSFETAAGEVAAASLELEHHRADAWRWPLRQVGLIVGIYSMVSFPADLITAQGLGVWTNLAGSIQVFGWSGAWYGLGQSSIGDYLFFAFLLWVLLPAGALTGVVGGLLCWWGYRSGRVVLGIGLLMAVAGGLAGVLQALSQMAMLHDDPVPLIALSLLGALWNVGLLALVLLAFSPDRPASSRSESRAATPLARLGLLFAFFGSLQLLSAGFGIPALLSRYPSQSFIPDLQFGIPFGVLSLAVPAAIVVAGAATWRGLHWGPRLAAWGWWGSVALGVAAAVGGWVALSPGDPAADGAVAGGAFSALFALLALWALRAIRLRLGAEGIGSPPAEPREWLASSPL
jgi:hypothetical protein